MSKDKMKKIVKEVFDILEKEDWKQEINNYLKKYPEGETKEDAVNCMAALRSSNMRRTFEWYLCRDRNMTLVNKLNFDEDLMQGLKDAKPDDISDFLEDQAEFVSTHFLGFMKK